MRRQTLTGHGVLGLGAVLLALALGGAGTGGPAVAQPPATATPGPPRGLDGAFTLTVDCAGTPERTTLANNLAGAPLNLRTFALGSLSAPGPNEPFRLAGILASGASRTYETGPGASVNPLSGEELYDDAAPREGARLTGFGTALDALCSTRTTTRAWRSDPPVPARVSPAVADPAVAAVPTGTAQTATMPAVPTATGAGPTVAPIPATTATVPSLPRTGGGRAGVPPLSPWSLGVGLLLTILTGAYVVRRHGWR